jgi:prenyltransferase beta subunit
MKKNLIFLILTLSLITGMISSAQSNVDTGLNWLLVNQNSDGSYGNQGEISFRDTEEVLHTFFLLNQKSSQYQSGLQWSQNNKASSTDFISRKILILSKENIDTTAGLNFLLDNQNSDGGWEITSPHESDTIDTALTLQALKAVNCTDQNIISGALGYLLSTQNPDGGWGFYQGGDSNVYMTALIVDTLSQYKLIYSLQSQIDSGIAYLFSRQNLDGGFGTSPSTVYETALAFLALIESGADISTIASKVINYLTSTQLSNGSWSNDSF